MQHAGGRADLQVDAEAQKPHDALGDRGVARLDLTHQRRPARLTQLARERQLRPGKRQRCRDGREPRKRSSIAAPGRVHQLLRLAPRLVEVRVLRKYRHDISSAARWSARQAWRWSQPATSHREVNSVLPADPEAPSHARTQRTTRLLRFCGFGAQCDRPCTLTARRGWPLRTSLRGAVRRRTDRGPLQPGAGGHVRRPQRSEQWAAGTGARRETESRVAGGPPRPAQSRRRAAPSGLAYAQATARVVTPFAPIEQTLAG